MNDFLPKKIQNVAHTYNLVLRMIHDSWVSILNALLQCKYF